MRCIEEEGGIKIVPMITDSMPEYVNGMMMKEEAGRREQHQGIVYCVPR